MFARLIAPSDARILKLFPLNFGSSASFLRSECITPKNIKFRRCREFCSVGDKIARKRNISLVVNSGNFIRIKLFSSSSFRFNQADAKPAKKQNLLLRVLKTVCLVTGASVWAALILVYLWVEDFKVEKSERVEVESPEAGAIPRDLRFLGVLNNDQSSDAEAIILNENDSLRNEVNQKLSAFNEVWQKLSKEEGVRLSLGGPVEICGYKCNNGTIMDTDLLQTDDDGNNKWSANCYIEGKKGAGVLSILFERLHTESEWIPTRVHLETLKESGEIVCNVSGNLPHGLRNFTRLSDV